MLPFARTSRGTLFQFWWGLLQNNYRTRGGSFFFPWPLGVCGMSIKCAETMLVVPHCGFGNSEFASPLEPKPKTAHVECLYHLSATGTCEDGHDRFVKAYHVDYQSSCPTVLFCPVILTRVQMTMCANLGPSRLKSPKRSLGTLPQNNSI